MPNFVFNEAMKIRRKTIIEICKLLENGNIEKEIAKLPKLILAKDKTKYRASVYHAREVLAQRIKIYLGLEYSKVKNFELYELINELNYILEKKSVFLSNENYINIIEEACDVCPTKSHYITDGCRFCVAKSCENVCPKKAISMVNGRMTIDNEKCINCGLCVKACTYNAVIVQERPCEAACSLKAIKADNIVPEINRDECVNCGKCFRECPFGAIETPGRLFQLQHDINKKEKVRAIFAPSIAGQFGAKVNSEQIKEALKKAGFVDAISAAVGADSVAKEEAKLVDQSDELITTSCCPAFVDCITKHYPKFKDNISHELSPMAYLAREIKQRYPKDKIAFIGPCIAKKSEGDNSDYIDYVIGFEELGALFIAKKVEPSQLEGEAICGSDSGWDFAKSGGVASAVELYSNKKMEVLKMNGLSEAKKSFALAQKGKFDLFEGMACSGGCVGGPGIMVNKVSAIAKLKTEKK